MKLLFDIVNFNPDASCLDSKDWIQALKGGTKSLFYQWLYLYVSLNKKMTLGLTGAGAADVLYLNPEAVELINENPNIFELIHRPFSHDIALLRSRKGFEINVDCGSRLLKNEFRNVSNFFLPPEFMLTAEQIQILYEKGFQSVFINSTRMRESHPNAIPTTPYLVKGTFQSQIPCIPVMGHLVRPYLESLQRFDSQIWRTEVSKVDMDNIFFWRDGESPFLIPDGIEREKFWLKNETQMIERKHLSEISKNQWIDFLKSNGEPRVYPLHPFSAWLREFRLMGFLRRMFSLENSVQEMAPEQLNLWMYMINSDVLSSVEKKSPQILLKKDQDDDQMLDFIIRRTDRHLEGEECMVLLEEYHSQNMVEHLKKTSHPEVLKLNARLKYLGVKSKY